MKVLFVNGADSALQAAGGGDAIIMRETAACLRELGVDVAIAEQDLPNCRGFDVVHLFNVEMAPSALQKFRHLKASGKPLVVSPIFWDQWEFLYGGTIVEATFGRGWGEDQIRETLDALAVRNVNLDGRGYATLTPFSEAAPRQKREVVAGADMVLVSGPTEAMCLQQSLGLTSFKWRQAVYGIYPEHYEQLDISDGERKYVLFTGRWLDPKKNVLLLAEALRPLGYPLVIIGDNQPPEREAMVRARLPENTLILNRLTPAELAHWYSAARVHCLPSWYEIPGIVSIEAAAAAAPVVCSNRGSQVDYFGDFARYVDPFSVESIRTALKDAWENLEADEGRRYYLRGRAMAEFTWPRAAKQTLAAYREVLAARGRSRGRGDSRRASARTDASPR